MQSAHAEITCDVFELKVVLESNNILSARLETDLPDDTGIMVSAIRTYTEVGNPNTNYFHKYFQEKTTVGKWKNTQRIPLDNLKWKKGLMDFQTRMNRLGPDMAFQVASISDDVEFAITVPYTKGLRGKQVDDISSNGYGVIRQEKLVNHPLSGSTSNLYEKQTSLDPNSLDIGATYIVSKQTPIMPATSGGRKELKQVKYLPKGRSFTIIKSKVNPQVGHRVWYYVAIDGVSAGWVNSAALIGQKLSAIDE